MEKMSRKNKFLLSILTLIMTASIVMAGANTLSRNVKGATSPATVDFSRPYTDYGGATTGKPHFGINFLGGYNQAASWGVDKAVISEGITNADLFVVKKIGEEKALTVKEWQTKDAASIKRIGCYGTAIILYFDKPTMLSAETVEYMTIKKGFCLANGAAWGNEDAATAIKASALAKDVTFVPNLKDEKLEPAVKGLTSGTVATDAITLVTDPTKKTYTVDDEFDPTGMKIKVKLHDDTEKTIDVVSSMVSYNFKHATTPSVVTVNYGGGKLEYNIVIDTEKNVSFVIKDTTKKAYFFGDSFDMSSLYLTFTTNKNNTSEKTASEIADKLTITGFNTGLVKKGGKPITQTITVKCDGIANAVTYDITVTDKELDFPLKVAYGKNAHKDSFQIEFEKTTAVGLKLLWNAQNCELIKNNILINGKTVAEIKAEFGEASIKRVYLHQEGGSPMLRFHMDDKTALALGDIKTVTIKRGFMWYTNTGDNTADNDGWKNYTPIEGCGVDTDIHLVFDATGKVMREVADENGITVKTQPTKKSYFINEELDFTGLELEVNYKDGGSEVVSTFNNADFTYDFTTAGTKTVTLKYNNKDVALNDFVITNLKPKSITITNPTKLAYNLGEKIDVAGGKVNVTLKDLSGGADQTTQLDLTAEMLKYDRFTVGEKVVTVSYGGVTATFNVTYTDANPDINLEASMNSNVFLDNNGSLIMTLQFNNIDDSRKAIWWIDLATNADDKIFLMGKDGAWQSVGELKKLKGTDENPYLARVCAYGDTLHFHLDSKDYLKDDIKKIKIEAGFYMCKHTADNWGGGADIASSYVEIPNAIVRQTVVMENKNGKRWTRPLSADADAITIVSNPTKMEYKVGETLDLTGMVVKFKFEDGHVMNYIPNINNVSRPINGEFTEAKDAFEVVVLYNGQQIKFNVKVTEEEQKPVDPPKKGCACGTIALGGAGGIGGIGLMLGAIVLSVVALKRKKGSYEK